MRWRAISLALAAALAAGCGDDDESATTDAGDQVDIDPAEFSAVVDHPYFPMPAGSVWRYEERGDGATETITVEVLDERRTVMGVETIVVRDVVETGGGEIVEDTRDWYAQDSDGNVWYFGEETTAYEDGVATTEGSWEAGVDGALPGIAMPADPEVTGESYRQEYLAGEAEDMGQVIATDASASVPFGDFTGALRTRDWTPLEPGVVEEKTYARGIGLVHEVKTMGEDAGTETVLVEFTAGT